MAEEQTIVDHSSNNSEKVDGGTLLWIATIAIILQAILNTESIRYTLYTGEPMFSGFMRCRPGSKFWSIVYLITDLGGIWPAWAMTAATALAAAWLGYLPSDNVLSDQNTVRLFICVSHFLRLFINCHFRQ